MVKSIKLQIRFHFSQVCLQHPMVQLQGVSQRTLSRVSVWYGVPSLVKKRRVHPPSFTLFGEPSPISRRPMNAIRAVFIFFILPLFLQKPIRRVVEMEFGGMDSDGRTFASVSEMWREAIGDEYETSSSNNNKKAQWYRDGVAYWQNVEASVDGVLGGYGGVNDQDIKGSEAFLTSILHDRRLQAHSDLIALDCGSGIGRITDNLLLKHFRQVDLLEPVSHFLEAARKNLAPGIVVNSDHHSAVNFFCIPLQEFTPESGRYHVIWVQWCIGHLTDDDFVSFFKRAKTGLRPGGFFVLKENIAKTGFVLDKEDRSITRSDLYFRQLFKQCGLHLYKVKEQKGLPEELFAVKMYALTTEHPKSSNKRKCKQQTNQPGII